MMVSITLLVMTVAAMAVGGTVQRLAGGDGQWSWLNPALGLAACMVVAAPGAYLPGGVLIPGIVLALLAAPEIRRWTIDRASRPDWQGLGASAPVALMSLLPFIASERFGVPGVNVNNDTAAHLSLIQAMFSPSAAAAYPLLPYYPVGPHGVIAIVAGTGISADWVLTAFLLLIPLLTAMTAQVYLAGTPWFIRLLGTACVALTYLLASYLAQGAFKETLMALLVLAFVAGIDQLDDGRGLRQFWVLAVLAAGAVSTYSYPGLVWLVAVGGLVLLWSGARALRVRETQPIGSKLRRLAWSAGTAGLLLVLLLAPQLRRIQAFYDWSKTTGIAADDLGNLPGPLDWRELTGVWWTPDFRLAPAGTLASNATQVGAVLVVALFIGAALWWARQRPVPTVPLAAIGCLAIVALLADGQSPYTVAKAMVIASPFVPLTIAVAASDWWSRLATLAGRIAIAAATLAAALLATWPASTALRGAQVGPVVQREQLAAFQPTVRGHTVLFLGYDDFIYWRLNGAKVVQPFYGVPWVTFRASKQFAPGEQIDADTIQPREFDRFDFLVTPRAAGASELPENFVRRATSGPYALWERQGATPARRVLPGELANGAAPLRCGDPQLKRLLRVGGTAHVVQPIVDGSYLTPITPRRPAAVTFELTPGTWDLALQYVSARPLAISGPGLRRTLPANLDRAGNAWPAGRLTVDQTGPVTLTVAASQPELAVDGNTQVFLNKFVAQRRGPARSVPLADACGKLVDWYLPAPQAGKRR